MRPITLSSTPAPTAAYETLKDTRYLVAALKGK